MDVTTVQAIGELDYRVKAATQQFYNSAVAGTAYDPVLGHIFGETQLTATDILLVAALSQVHVLVTGPTGRGKTDLVKLVCQGLFGRDGWFLLRLNPHLTEDTFADVNMRTLTNRGLRQAILPAPFLRLPCTVLDECNRTPAALTNIILGFADGRIELKCGVKFDVGYYANGRGNECDADGRADGGASSSQAQDDERACLDDEGRTPGDRRQGFYPYKGLDEEDWTDGGVSNNGRRYHLVIGTMNEGKEYAGTFDLDPALSRRFTLRIPFSELRPTPHDLVSILEKRTGHAKPVSFDNAIGELVQVTEAVSELPLDPLAFVFLVYLGNVGRCPYSPSGYHPEDGSQRLCTESECRIQKRANGFCPSVAGLSEGVLIFLKRAACGLAALRAARTLRSISQLCETEDAKKTDQLRAFAEAQAEGEALRNAAVVKYVEGLSVSAEDVKAVLPFVALGGKVWLAQEYVAKHFAGSAWSALQHYGRETYGALESFFREHQTLFQQLGAGNGAIQKLKQRLEHAERFTDPAIRHALQPFIERYESRALGPEEVAHQIRISEPVRGAVSELMCG